MKKTFFLIVSFLCITTFSQEKKICITIDDLPTVTYGTSNLDEEIISKFVTIFKKHQIPAIGYVNEKKLYRNNQLDSNKVKILAKWLKNGYDLGNHTYSHFDYNKVSDSIFYNDVINGEKIIKPLMLQYGKQLKYFRHPFLHAGADSIRFNKLELFLKKNNYISAPVTFDNDDYLFAKSYHNAFINKDNDLMKYIGKEYIKYMEQKLLYFESKSIQVFNKNIPQTLLIHASLLNADYLGKLADMMKRHGYTFISQEEVLQSPEYATPVTTYSERGISWIFRWGISKGVGDDLTTGNVAMPKKIIELAKQ